MIGFVLGALFALGCVYLNGLAFAAMFCTYATLAGMYAASWWYL